MLECDITSALATGLNTIEFKLNFVYADPGCYNNAARRLGTELESAFITGDFAVYGEPVEVGTLPKQISHDIWSTELPARRVTRLRGPLYITDSVMQTSGELTLAGLPFYSGTVKLSKEFNLPHLDFTKISFKYLDAITARVKLNGQEVKHLFSSRPLQADIKGMLQKGNNLIEIELRNSLRNLLGPHHHTMGELCSVGPYSFISRDFQEGKFVPEKNWSKAENRIKQESWTDDYFFVKFGLPNGIELLKF